MLNNTIFLLFFSLLLISCGRDSDNNASSDTPATAEQTDADDSVSGILPAACLEFLSAYETFMDEYITVLTKYKENPTDIALLKEYTAKLSESTTWDEGMEDCADNSEFLTKFREIQLKIADVASGL